MNYIPGFSNYLETIVPRYALGGRVMDGEPMMYDEPMMYGGYDMGGYSEMPYGGGGVLPAPAEQQYQQAAVEPMTQEVAPAVGTLPAADAAPNYMSDLINNLRASGMSEADLAGLANFSGIDDSLYGLNFGSNFGGGAMGGIYPNDPNLQYINAPISNKGNPTSPSGNVFTMTPDQKVRLVDLNTNTVIFEGTGYDAAREATRLGQNLTDTMGRKAQYNIQTANPAGEYTTVANEKKNKSTLGTIADVVGTVAPLALGFVPGFGQLGLLAKMGAAAGAGGLGAALKGDDILKGALLGGATAGIVSGTGLDKALGGALGGLGKGATQGAVTAGSKAAADATGDIIATGLSKVLQGTGNAAANALVSNVGKAGLNSVSGSNPPPQNLAQQTPVGDYAGLDPIDVLARKVSSGSGLPFAASFPVPVGAMLAGTLNTAQPTPTEKTAEDIEAEKNPMVVKAYRPINPVGGFAPTSVSKDLIGLGGSVAAGLPALTELAMDPTLAEPAAEDIVVTGNKAIPKTVVPDTLAPVGSVLASLGLQAIPTPDPALTKKPLGVEDYLGLAGKAVGLVGNLVGGGGGGGSGTSGTYTPGGRGLNPIFSAKLPAAGGLGNIGATRTARPMGDVDWLTYGTRPELNFFDYAQPTNPAPVTTPVPGNPAGPIMTADTPVKPLPDMYEPLDRGWLPPKEQILTPAQMADLEKQRIDQYAYLNQFTPTAEEIARNGVLYGNNEAAGPIMTAEETPRMAEGGAFAAKRGGRSQRTEFAVNGPGTGRSDDIPAVLSDGEYVIDAETVALLGDGSSKAGAKKLDDLRVKVRKHKGQKLAKGRFSANAKKPEAYLSGGRI